MSIPYTPKILAAYRRKLEAADRRRRIRRILLLPVLPLLLLAVFILKIK
ncbi:hypothetical protein [Victivallis vadensis]|nr:hypothetical protein [Victivallis vadensis]